jgi:hypothetical protein
MGERSHREMIDRFIQSVPHDIGAMREVCHGDFVQEFPQSGERFEGLQNLYDSHQHYPGGKPGVNKEVRRVVGSEDNYVMTPSFTILRITGTGDVYTVENLGGYPDGSEWHVVNIIEFREDKISKSTTYFAHPFDAPEWRAKWSSGQRTDGKPTGS